MAFLNGRRNLWRTACVMVVVSVCHTQSADSQDKVTTYDIAIASVPSGDSAISLSCHDDQKPCRAILSIAGKHASNQIDVEIIINPGNAYFGFKLSDKPLWVNRLQEFYHMDIGPKGGDSVAIGLYENPLNQRHEYGSLLTDDLVSRAIMEPPFTQIALAVKTHH